MFVNGLVLLAYACQGGYWYLWVAALGTFGIVGSMASRALANMVRDGELDPAAPSSGSNIAPPFM